MARYRKHLVEQDKGYRTYTKDQVQLLYATRWNVTKNVKNVSKIVQFLSKLRGLPCNYCYEIEDGFHKTKDSAGSVIEAYYVGGKQHGEFSIKYR